MQNTILVFLGEDKISTKYLINHIRINDVIKWIMDMVQATAQAPQQSNQQDKDYSSKATTSRNQGISKDPLALMTRS